MTSVHFLAKQLPRGMSVDDKLSVLRFLFDDDRITHRKGQYGVLPDRFKPLFEDMLVGLSVDEARKLCGEMHIELDDESRGVSLVASGDCIGYEDDGKGRVAALTGFDFDPDSYSREWLEALSFFEHHLLGLTLDQAAQLYCDWGIAFILRDTEAYPKYSRRATNEPRKSDAGDVIYVGLDENGRIDDVCLQHYKLRGHPQEYLHHCNKEPVIH